jgi:uroporphyrinogen decarboxylase
MNMPKREPNFQNIINQGHIERLAGEHLNSESGDSDRILRLQVKGFWAAGYDYAVVPPWLFRALNFPAAKREQGQSIGMAHGGVIQDRASFEKYPWPDPEATDWDALERLKPHMSAGMKLLICGHSGVLENLVSLLGFEELCYMLNALLRDGAPA